MLRPQRALPILVILLAAVLALGLWLYVPDPGEDAPQVVVSVDRTLWNRLGLNQFTYVRALRRAGVGVRLVGFPSDDGASDVTLLGPAEHVFTGELEYPSAP